MVEAMGDFVDEVWGGLLVQTAAILITQQGLQAHELWKTREVVGLELGGKSSP